MPVFLIVWLWLLVVALVLLAVLRPDRHISWLVIVALLVAVCVWIVLPTNPGVHLDTNRDGITDFDKPLDFRQGLDLAGGLKVLLEAQSTNDEPPTEEQMAEISRIVENRVDSLGALEPVIQIQGGRRLIVELPGYEDPEAAVELIRTTAQLEFVDMGGQVLPYGSPVVTSLAVDQGRTDEEVLASQGGVPLETVMTGDVIANAEARSDQLGLQYIVGFTLSPTGRTEFGNYTEAHMGEPLGIVIDGILLSAPTIQAKIDDTGQITGSFALEDAQRLATQLRYGALPLSLTVDSTSTVGPTLGQVSVEKSIRAGIVGIIIVISFMIFYYRIPGFAAALALLVFALINLALYKFVPITMTLPAITGFLIGVGTAVDGNILIFERLKEELAAGKRLNKAVEAGFDRAFPSIRDSNISTIIICAVLWGFGTSFGAGAVRGFAVTLAMSLVINLFTAIIVTRTFLHFILMLFNDDKLVENPFWMGLVKDGPLAQQRLIAASVEASRSASVSQAVEESAAKRSRRSSGRRRSKKSRR